MDVIELRILSEIVVCDEIPLGIKSRQTKNPEQPPKSEGRYQA